MTILSVKNSCTSQYVCMLMPNRHASTAAYRFGHQGSEKDDKIKGTSNSYTTEYRILYPRLGRWMNTDALASSYPWQSPYTIRSVTLEVMLFLHNFKPLN